MMRGTPLNTQMQKAVISAYQFFEKEKNNGCVISVSRPIDRTASALGLSRSTVCHYLGKWRRGEELVTPGKRRPRSKPKREVDDMTKNAIRNIIYDLHVRGANITVTTLLAELRQIKLGVPRKELTGVFFPPPPLQGGDRKSEVSFKGARETLRRVLHDLGFKFSKTDGRRYVLQEATNETKPKSKKSAQHVAPSQPQPPPAPPPVVQMQPHQLPQISQAQHVPVSQAQHVPVSQSQHVSVSQSQHVSVSQSQHVSVSQSQHVPVSQSHVSVSQSQHVSVSQAQHVPVSQAQHVPVSQAQTVTHPQHLQPVSHVPQTHHHQQQQQQQPHLQVPQVSHLQHPSLIQQTSHMQQTHLHMSHVQQLPHPADTRPRPCLPREDIVSALHSIAGLMQRSDGSYVEAPRH